MTATPRASNRRDLKLAMWSRSRPPERRRAFSRSEPLQSGVRQLAVQIKPQWRAKLIAGTILWPALYIPLALLLLTGWRPPTPFVRTLIRSLCAAHTAMLLCSWGVLRLRHAWLASTEHRQYATVASISQLQRMDPADFEAFTGQIFARLDYRVVNTPFSSDHGIDLRVTGPDGLSGIVQCKRSSGTVGEPVLRDLYGTLVHTGADIGYLVTSGAISQAARRWARGKPLELIDGERLLRMAR